MAAPKAPRPICSIISYWSILDSVFRCCWSILDSIFIWDRKKSQMPSFLTEKQSSIPQIIQTFASSLSPRMELMPSKEKLSLLISQYLSLFSKQIPEFDAKKEKFLHLLVKNWDPSLTSKKDEWQTASNFGPHIRHQIKNIFTAMDHLLSEPLYLSESSTRRQQSPQSQTHLAGSSISCCNGLIHPREIHQQASVKTRSRGFKLSVFVFPLSASSSRCFFLGAFLNRSWLEKERQVTGKQQLTIVGKSGVETTSRQLRGTWEHLPFTPTQLMEALLIPAFCAGFLRRWVPSALGYSFGACENLEFRGAFVSRRVKFSGKKMEK